MVGKIKYNIRSRLKNSNQVDLFYGFYRLQHFFDNPELS